MDFGVQNVTLTWSHNLSSFKFYKNEIFMLQPEVNSICCAITDSEPSFHFSKSREKH